MGILVDTDLIEQRLRAIEKEAEELRAFLRLAPQYGKAGILLPAKPNAPAPKAVPASGKKSKLGPDRPSGIPTNYQMVELILKEAQAQGKPGLTVREIVQTIDKRYWPGIEDGQIMPSIYGFVKDTRLHKSESGIFSVAQKNTASSAEAKEALSDDTL
jgi:hypothetical protein